MNPSVRSLLPLSLLLVVSLALALGLCNSDPRKTEASRMVGQTPGLFNVTVLGDKKGQFTPTEWLGKPVVLNVFASWCEPCVVEHPVVMKLSQSGKAYVIGLAWRERADRVTEWLTKHGNPYQQIGIDEFGQATVPLGLSGVPETFVIDAKGKIAYHTRSVLTDDEVNNVILPLLSKLNAGHARP